MTPACLDLAMEAKASYPQSRIVIGKAYFEDKDYHAWLRVGDYIVDPMFKTKMNYIEVKPGTYEEEKRWQLK